MVEALHANARMSGQRFISLAADVVNEAALSQAFAKAAGQLGAPQLIINSASVRILNRFC